MSSIQIEKEKKFLEKTLRDAFHAENQKDIDKQLDYLANDIIVFPSSSPMIRGKESMRELYERFLSNVESMTGESKYVGVSASGDLRVCCRLDKKHMSLQFYPLRVMVLDIVKLIYSEPGV